MKRFITGMITALVLILALGAAALAESQEAEGLPADQQQASEEVQTEAAAESDALQEALQAFREARTSSRLKKLEEELKGFVDTGTLTQEQADLVLEYYRENLSSGRGMRTGHSSQDGGKADRSSGSRGGKGGHQGTGNNSGSFKDKGTAKGASSGSGKKSNPDSAEGV